MSNPGFNVKTGSHSMLLELVDISDQLMRFRATLRNKYFILEENRLQEWEKWKITEVVTQCEFS